MKMPGTCLKTVGGDEVLSADVQGIAENIVKECGGLPIAIITVGQALGASFQCQGMGAMNHMNSSAHQQESKPPLHPSCERLRNDNVKTCLLY
ncbi:hypothetical protein MRB53_000536 [Persea americana]|uniref:Uncharacterized protein n=1 Tax=Persea americana TaxID=3435 RepID=A0ACC2MPE4_PERAE|nr:hypothetical protein MRB53_000536 [Persea americana]